MVFLPFIPTHFLSFNKSSNMKYSSTIIIDRPIDQVVALFDNPDNLSKWMEGLLSFEHLEGDPGQPGARSRLRFRMGKRELEMIETVKERNLPHRFSGTYEAKGVLNEITNRFERIDDTHTRYSTDNTFHFTGMMRLFAPLMKGVFKKQSMKYLVAFKNFAERN
jgi:hypothetical protein